MGQINSNTEFHGESLTFFERMESMRATNIETWICQTHCISLFQQIITKTANKFVFK